MGNFERKDIEIKLGRYGNLVLLLILPLVLFVLAFIFDAPDEIIHGLYAIIVSPDVLLTDYLKVGGIGATLLNSSILGFLNLYIIYKLKLKINGGIIAAFFAIIGFSFIGKNIFNVWPMYIGGLLYVKYQKIHFKNILVIIMFSTALAPVVSELSFALGLPIWLGMGTGISFGILCGFIVSPLSAHMSKFHDGYNLYNIGFTAGVLGTLINSILKSFGINVNQQQILSSEFDTYFKIFLLIYFIFLVIFGLIVNRKSFKGYTEIFNFSGRTVSDFTYLIGNGLTYINMGFMGLLAMAFVKIAGGTYNGPIVGGILTLVGFSAFGNHPKNSIPIMMGVIIAGLLQIWDINSTSVIIAGLFGTTLAPIAGRYGIFSGILAGFVHLSVVMNVGIMHGGINLYNNGFSGGITAAILVPLFDSLKKGD